MNTSDHPPEAEARTTTRPWRPDWADVVFFLGTLGITTAARAGLTRVSTPEQAGELIGYGCGTACILGFLFSGIRAALFSVRRASAQSLIHRNPFISLFIGVPTVILIFGLMTFSYLLQQRREGRKFKADMARVLEATGSGKPFSGINPDDPAYGNYRPIMQYMVPRATALSSLNRDILETQKPLGTPLMPPDVTNPARVDENLKHLEGILPKLHQLSPALEEFAGEKALQAISGLDMDKYIKNEFIKGLNRGRPEVNKGLEIASMSRDFYVQMQKMLQIVRRDQPTERNGKIVFRSEQNRLEYLQEEPIFQRISDRLEKLVQEAQAERASSEP